MTNCETEILFSAKDLTLAIHDTIGPRLHAMYGVEPPLFVVLKQGGLPFYRRLRQEMEYSYEWTPEVVFVRASSYNGTERGDLTLSWTNDLDANKIWNRDVLVIDDIVDSGATLAGVRRLMQNLGANDVEACTMLRRHSTPIDAHLTFLWTLPDDAFVVGEGMDLDGQLRHLDGIHRVIGR